MVDLEIVDKKENPLLKRTEVRFRLVHPKEKTPQRGAVRDKIAASLGGKKDAVVVSEMHSRFGNATTVGFAKLYESAEVARKTEPIHVLKRNGLYIEPKKREAPAAKAGEAPPPPPPKKPGKR